MKFLALLFLTGLASTVQASDLRQCKIALTLDDGPTSHSMDMMRIMDDYNVPALFCWPAGVPGPRVFTRSFQQDLAAGREPTLTATAEEALDKLIDSRGRYRLCDHSVTHTTRTVARGVQANSVEMGVTTKALRNVRVKGRYIPEESFSRFARTPGGYCQYGTGYGYTKRCKQTFKLIEQSNLILIHWEGYLKFGDPARQNKGVDHVLSTYCRHGGGIMLVHDTSAGVTAFVRSLMERGSQRGVQFVHPEEVIDEKRGSITPKNICFPITGRKVRDKECEDELARRLRATGP